jgi:hypothetical protein
MSIRIPNLMSAPRAKLPAVLLLLTEAIRVPSLYRRCIKQLDAAKDTLGGKLYTFSEDFRTARSSAAGPFQKSQIFDRIGLDFKPSL